MKRRISKRNLYPVFLCLMAFLTGMSPEKQPEAEKLVIESPVFTGDVTRNQPKKEIEKHGKRYFLISSELKEARTEERQKEIFSETVLKLEGEDPVPQSAEIIVRDEDMKKDYPVTIPILEQKELSSEWQDGFSFPVTAEGYGSDHMMLGEVEIPDPEDLSGYGTELLSYLGLREQDYRVEEVVWKGPPYEENGVLFRDGEARGKKRIRTVGVRYQGVVTLPPLDGKQYVSVYCESLPETEPVTEEDEEKETRITEPETESVILETEAVKDVEEEKGFLKFLAEHLTVITMSLFFLLFLLISVLLCYHLFSRKDEQETRG